MMKTFKQYIKEEVNKPKISEDLANLTCFLLECQTQIHICHFLIKTGFKHTALNDLYDDLNEWSDGIAEKCIGMTQELKFTKYEIILEHYSNPLEKSLEILDNLKIKINENLIIDDEGIKSYLSDILHELDSYRYKLEHFND